jgi:hypothetical protein
VVVKRIAVAEKHSETQASEIYPLQILKIRYLLASLFGKKAVKSCRLHAGGIVDYPYSINGG